MKQHQYQYFFEPLRRWVLRVLPSPQFGAVFWSLVALVLLSYCMVSQ